MQAAWVCGRCGSIAGDMPRCWDCGAQLIPGHLPVLRFKPAPMVVVLVTLGIVGVVVALVWAVTPGQGGQNGQGGAAATAPATIRPAFVGATPAEPAATPDPGAAQARAVNALLAESRHTRSPLMDTVGRAGRCDPSAVSDLSAIAEARSRQLADAQSLEVDALPDGGQLKDVLVA